MRHRVLKDKLLALVVERGRLRRDVVPAQSVHGPGFSIQGSQQCVVMPRRARISTLVSL